MLRWSAIRSNDGCVRHQLPGVGHQLRPGERLHAIRNAIKQIGSKPVQGRTAIGDGLTTASKCSPVLKRGRLPRRQLS